MTDAWATIIAAIITSVITGIATLIGLTRKSSYDDYSTGTNRVLPYVGIGLVVGAGIGGLIGYVLLIKPHPSARITEPTNGQLVPIYAKVAFEYNNIPPDRHLWPAVRIPGVGSVRWLIYPQLRGIEAIGTGKGFYETMAAFGGENDSSGRPFNVVILLADEDANSRFVEYAKECNLDSNLCNGMVLPDKGVEILDFDTVIRK